MIGGGIVGLCTALWLQREGLDVALVERAGVAAGCSSGHGGLLATFAVEPLAMPGVLAALPRMLLDPGAPFVIPPARLPGLLPWLARFAWASRRARVEQISLALAALLREARAAYAPLLDAAGASELVRSDGVVLASRDPRAFLDGPITALWRRRGIAVEPLTGDGARRIEPALGRDVESGLLVSDAGHMVDPRALSSALAALFARQGGTTIHGEVRDVATRRDGGLELALDRGRLAAGAAVLAAGAHSKRLAARMGARTPLETERGYHVMLPRPGLALRRPVIAIDGGFAITPMADGVRLAGTVELGGLDAPASGARADLIAARARAVVPGLDTTGATRWMGLRPSLPDSLPVIGRSPRHPAMYFAFGHGHLGATLAAITGRCIAALAAGRPPPIDLAPYRPERFVMLPEIRRPGPR